MTTHVNSSSYEYLAALFLKLRVLSVHIGGQ